MSYQTWLDEFYPLPADLTTREEAAAHSLRKWTGLRRESLAKHGISEALVGSRRVIDDKLIVDSTSCALCHHNIKTTDSLGCETCILCEVRGGYPCDHGKPIEDDADRLSPWDEWQEDANPEPMIIWLRKAVEKQATK